MGELYKRELGVSIMSSYVCVYFFFFLVVCLFAIILFHH